MDPALRQAYDNFGHSAVAVVRHNRYGEDSLYLNLIKLHDDGKSSEALEVLQIVLEDKKWKECLKEWEFNADVEVNMHAGRPDEDTGAVEWPEVTSTNVSLSATVPMPPQTADSVPTYDNNHNQTATKKKQKMQLSIGGHSNIEKGLGSTRGMLSATYQPVPQTAIVSDLTIGRKSMETSVSTSTVLSNDTGLSAKMTRQYELGSDKDGTLGFGFSSNRTLTMVHGRRIHAMFALGVNSNLNMRYGVLSLTTWGFNATTNQKEEPDKPLPRLSAKMTIGSQFPIECNIDQPHLFDCPHRSGRASISWGPLQGYKLKAILSRKLFTRKCNYHESEYASNLSLGVEHTGLSGLKWVMKYQRPEGLTIRVPIFISSFLSLGYWNKVTQISLLSLLFDETLEEFIGKSTTDLTEKQTDKVDIHKVVSTKLLINEREMHWLNSSKAKQNAESQLLFIIPIAKMKRQREEANDGLVIIKATYESIDTSLDCKDQLQFWVDNSQLCLPPSSKSLLLGMYDLVHERSAPRVDGSGSAISDFIHKLTCKANIWLSRLGIGGENSSHQKLNIGRTNKHDLCAVTLTVRYRFKDGVYEIRVNDNDSLTLPSRDASKLGSSDVIH